MDRYTVTEQNFLKDVATHQMTVIAEHGLHRHIRFKKPGTMFDHFDIVTWPGYLCYTGDRGTYVFHRLEDMLGFFRKAPRDEEMLPINPQYWQEKLESIDRDGVKEYSEDLFKKEIREWLDDIEASPEMREQVEDEVISCADQGEHEAVRAAIDFCYEDDYPFLDFYNRDVKEYTNRFTWCCYALVWGIRMYDEARQAEALTAA